MHTLPVWGFCECELLLLVWRCKQGFCHSVLLTCHSFMIHFTINPKTKASFFAVLSFINHHLTVIEKMGGEKGEKISVWEKYVWKRETHSSRIVSMTWLLCWNVIYTYQVNGSSWRECWIYINSKLKPEQIRKQVGLSLIYNTILSPMKEDELQNVCAAQMSCMWM